MNVNPFIRLGNKFPKKGIKFYFAKLSVPGKCARAAQHAGADIGPGTSIPHRNLGLPLSAKHIDFGYRNSCRHSTRHRSCSSRRRPPLVSTRRRGGLNLKKTGWQLIASRRSKDGGARHRRRGTCSHDEAKRRIESWGSDLDGASSSDVRRVYEFIADDSPRYAAITADRLLKFSA